MKVRRGFEEALNLPDDTGPARTNELISKLEANPFGEGIDDEESLKSDYKFARRAIRRSIRTSQEVVEVLLEDLAADPSPRMAEVTTRLLESIGSNSSLLLDAARKITDIFRLAETTNKTIEHPTYIENAIIVGSLNDVLKLQGSRKTLSSIQAPVDSYGDPYDVDIKS